MASLLMHYSAVSERNLAQCSLRAQSSFRELMYLSSAMGPSAVSFLQEGKSVRCMTHGLKGMLQMIIVMLSLLISYVPKLEEC